jgi:hypothetical protein
MAAQSRSGSNENDVLVSHKAGDRTVAHIPVGDNIVTAQAGQSWQPLSLALVVRAVAANGSRGDDAPSPGAMPARPLGHAGTLSVMHTPSLHNLAAHTGAEKKRRASRAENMGQASARFAPDPTRSGVVAKALYQKPDGRGSKPSQNGSICYAACAICRHPTEYPRR